MAPASPIPQSTSEFVYKRESTRAESDARIDTGCDEALARHLYSGAITYGEGGRGGACRAPLLEGVVRMGLSP